MARKFRCLEKQLEFGDYTLLLFLYNKESQVVDTLLEKHNILLEGGTSHCEGFTSICMDTIIIALKNNFSLETLIHELQHATFKMLDRYSIKLSLETEETFAMQMESLFRIVIKMLKEDKYKLPEL